MPAPCSPTPASRTRSATVSDSMPLAPEMSDVTVDAFHRGGFHLVQPRKGHRAGMDAMALAASVPSRFAGHAVDLGAGAGAAGLAVISRCVEAHVTLVEREPVMLDCARRSLALAQNRHLAGRAAILDADVTLTGRARVEAGLADASFDFAIMNPPFNSQADRATPDPLRKAAHVLSTDLFEAWIRTAAAVLRPGGGLAIIARPVSLPEVVAALEGRFGGARIVLIHPRADAPAIRFIVRAAKGSRARLAFLPPFILHHGATDPPPPSSVTNGTATLFGD